MKVDPLEARYPGCSLTGPVPYAVEEFRLEPDGDDTEIVYEGELGIDYFALGRLAGRKWVTPQWNAKVREHLEAVKSQAEQRGERARRRRGEDESSPAEEDSKEQ